jgi:hypothetical protein
VSDTASPRSLFGFQLPTDPAHLSDHDQSGVDTGTYRQLKASNRTFSASTAFTISRPLRTARCASSSWAFLLYAFQKSTLFEKAAKPRDIVEKGNVFERVRLRVP